MFQRLNGIYRTPKGNLVSMMKWIITNLMNDWDKLIEYPNNIFVIFFIHTIISPWLLCNLDHSLHRSRHRQAKVRFLISRSAIRRCSKLSNCYKNSHFRLFYVSSVAIRTKVWLLWRQESRFKIFFFLSINTQGFKIGGISRLVKQ